MIETTLDANGIKIAFPTAQVAADDVCIANS
jgi:hypothetical protein